MTQLKSLVVATLASVFLLFSFGLKEASANDSRRTIHVIGTAAKQVVPDTVVWQISSSQMDKSLKGAKAKSDKEMALIMSAVKALGASSKDIQTGYLSVSKEFNRDKYGNYNQFKGYRLSREISVKQKDVSKFDAFLSALLNSGEVGVKYSLASSDIVQVRAKARLKSVAVAKEKAVAMASVLGAEVGVPLSVEEDSFNPSYMANFRQINASSNSGLGTDTKTFAPGTIEVKVSVKVTFELE